MYSTDYATTANVDALCLGTTHVLVVRTTTNT